jgi:hypothetical protein
MILLFEDVYLVPPLYWGTFSRFIQLYAAKFFISELGAYNSIYKFFCL